MSFGFTTLFYWIWIVRYFWPVLDGYLLRIYNVIMLRRSLAQFKLIRIILVITAKLKSGKFQLSR